MYLFVKREELNWFCKTILKSSDRRDKSQSGLGVRDMASMNIIFAKVGDLVFLRESTVNQTRTARICLFFSAFEKGFIQEENKVSWVHMLFTHFNKKPQSSFCSEVTEVMMAECKYTCPAENQKILLK